MVIKTKNIDTKLKMGREFIKQISITTDDGSVFDRASLMKIIKGIQQKFIQKGKNVKMMVSMPTNFGQMRSAKSFSQTEDPLLVEDYEWENGDTVSYFSIYIWETPRNQNFGETENNDCLFKCLTELYGIYSFHPQLKTDAQLKKKLNLKETDKIPLKLIPTVEKLFGVNINIQNIFTSEGKYNKTANLECNDEHLTVIKNNGKNRKESSLLKNMSFGIKKLILVRENKNNVLTYDGEKELTMSWDEYNIEKQKSFKEKYTYATSPIQNDENSIQMDYNIYIEENEKIKTESKGKYNLEYAGWKIPNLVQQIIYNAHIGFDDPEEPTPKEQEWLSDSFMGGLIRLWADREKYDNAYLYDINSSYPVTLCDEYFTFPVKQVVFTKIYELLEVIQYGIYRCTIDAPFSSTLKTNKKINILISS